MSPRDPSTSRRRLLAGGLLGLGALAAACAAPAPAPAHSNPPSRPDARDRFAAIEAGFAGRLGVFALDTSSGATIGYRGDERFLLCSTGKLPTAAAVLARPGLLGASVRVDPARLVRNSPTTTTRAGQTMTVADLCVAALTVSDNTAENLLLDQLGGPEAVTAFVRAHGDTTTRLDRPEPALNSRGGPDGTWDTTTPAAMVATLRAVTLGPALEPAGRTRLVEWLVANTTGAQRIRAGLPTGWRTGDKTGSGDRNEVNDVAITWPPGRPPVLLAVYTDPGDPASPHIAPAVPAAAAAAVAALGLVP